MNSPPSQRKRLAAILAADAVGYSRLMAHDEQATVAALDAARSVFRTTIAAHDGRVIDTAGDSVLAIFETAAGAVTAAIVVQQRIEALVDGVPADRRMRFRIGVHMGDVIEKSDGTIYGDGVNIASRLEGLAQPGGIAVSDAVHGAVRNRIAATFEDLGDQQVKNIADPVHVYAARPLAPGVRLAQRSEAQAAGAAWRRLVQRHALVASMLALAVVGTVSAVFWLRNSAPPNAATAQSMSATIFAFKSAAGAAEERYASDFTRALITALGTRLSGWRLVAGGANSPGDRADRSAQPRANDSSDTLYQVEGEVRRAIGAVVVDAQVINMLTRGQVWSGRIEVAAAKLEQFPELLIARATNPIATALADAEVQRVAKLPVQTLTAVELVYRSWAVVVNENFYSAEAVAKILELCNSALRLDPDSAMAMACKAEAMLLPLDDIGAEVNRGFLDEADRLTAKAVSTAPTDPEIWRIRANTLRFQGKWAAALEARARMIQSSPTRAGALTYRAFVMVWSGNPERVFALTERALELDPSRVTYAEFARCEAYVLMGQFEKAIAACERAESEDPHWMVHIALTAAYAHQGDLAKAAAARDKAIARQPKLTLATFRASRKIKADHPKQWELYDKHWEPNLRKAGLREN